MSNIDFFPEFVGIPKEDRKKNLFVNVDQVSVPDEDPERKKLRSVVYAVNPLTGHPQSDIAAVMSKDTNPEVARYIRDNLLSPSPSSGTMDVDEALATVKTQNMSGDEYKNKLLRFIDKKNNSSKK